MTATEYRVICNALMRNHHERLLQSAIKRNDQAAISQETAILSKLQTNIERN
jgi:hypothetical protein